MPDYIADSSLYSDQNINEHGLNKSISHKQLFSKSETSNTDLKITTSEGDIVKLSAKSFYNFKSLLYDKKGQVYSDAGTITNHKSYREMTLSSGKSFTFSVTGNLNSEELNDIGKVIGQIDSIMDDMENGNMGNALEKALNMGGYDTVTKFSANLSIKKSYSMVSESIKNKIADVEDNLMKQIKEPVEQIIDHHFKNLLAKKNNNNDQIKSFLEQLQQHLFA